MSSISKMTLSRSINNGMKGEVMGLRPTESVCNLPLKKKAKLHKHLLEFGSVAN